MESKLRSVRNWDSDPATSWLCDLVQLLNFSDHYFPHICTHTHTYAHTIVGAGKSGICRAGYQLGQKVILKSSSFFFKYLFI